MVKACGVNFKSDDDAFMHQHAGWRFAAKTLNVELSELHSAALYNGV